jgi:type III pantothenate kinase
MTEILLLDLGSSSLKWQARSDAGVVLDEGREAWGTSQGAPMLPRLRPASIWMARVGPEQREESLRARIRAHYGKVPVVSVRPQALGPGGLRLDYDLRQFGADRYCALLGVLGHTSAPAVVVDAGTAVTVDLLGEGGRHLGGYILPGLRLGLDAVNRLFTPKLQAQVAGILGSDAEAFPEEPRHEPGHDTGRALLRGWMLGLAGAVERLGSRQAVTPEDLEWWLTGGDAAWLSTLLDRPVNLAPGLVFDGLWRHLRPDCAEGAGP